MVHVSIVWSFYRNDTPWLWLFGRTPPCDTGPYCPEHGMVFMPHGFFGGLKVG